MHLGGITADEGFDVADDGAFADNAVDVVIRLEDRFDAVLVEFSLLYSESTFLCRFWSSLGSVKMMCESMPMIVPSSLRTGTLLTMNL
jgi:hypothetical protein